MVFEVCLSTECDLLRVTPREFCLTVISYIKGELSVEQ